MRDRIISNVLIKMGNRIKKKELDYLENVLTEEFRDVQIKKESTELTEYNDSLRKLKDTFLATLIVENKSSRTISQYNLHLTQFAVCLLYTSYECIRIRCKCERRAW